ncbi:MAG TPA: hypothetical protein VIH99_08135 [Bdellovibrionota bacterium]|jgi:hypothetical protein
MRRAGLALAFGLLLSACSQVMLAGNDVPFTKGGKLRDEKKKPAKLSPEADPKAPGMIPAECEALLNKSQEWGVVPGGGKWRPATPVIALEAVQFFAGFHLVPESTSEYARAWMKEGPPATDARAEASLEKMSRAQACDPMLAHQLLLSLLSYKKWPKKDRKEIPHYFHQFVFNQQSRVAPSLARAVQLDVLAKSVRKGYVRVDAKALKNLQAWFDSETAKGIQRAEDVQSAREQWKLNQEEVRLSEEARERLGKLLPQP